MKTYKLTFRFPAAGDKEPPTVVMADGFDLKDGGAVFHRGQPSNLTNYYPLELIRSIELDDSPDAVG